MWACISKRKKHLVFTKFHCIFSMQISVSHTACVRLETLLVYCSPDLRIAPHPRLIRLIVLKVTSPSFQVVTEGRLILEFTFDDLMRIRSWHFSVRQHRELIPRSVIAMQVHVTVCLSLLLYRTYAGSVLLKNEDTTFVC